MEAYFGLIFAGICLLAVLWVLRFAVFAHFRAQKRWEGIEERLLDRLEAKSLQEYSVARLQRGDFEAKSEPEASIPEGERRFVSESGNLLT